MLIPPWQTGTYLYRVTSTNLAGEGPASTSVSKAPCDSQAATATGNPSYLPWTNNVVLSGVTFTEGYSGFQTAQYKYGALGWMSLPVQPTAGSTTWTPTIPLSGLPLGLTAINEYLAERNDDRVKDWASWVANAKFESEAHRAGSENVLSSQDPRGGSGGVNYLKMQAAMNLVIQKVMDENHIDLVVMGTHSRKGLDRIIFGSTADRVVRNSKCPVLTVGAPHVKK